MKLFISLGNWDKLCHCHLGLDHGLNPSLGLGLRLGLGLGFGLNLSLDLNLGLGMDCGTIKVEDEVDEARVDVTASTRPFSLS